MYVHICRVTNVNFCYVDISSLCKTIHWKYIYVGNTNVLLAKLGPMYVYTYVPIIRMYMYIRIRLSKKYSIPFYCIYMY